MPKIPTKVLGVETTAPVAFERWGKEFPAPLWMSVCGEAVLYHGHVLDQLARLPSRSVHMCVTSPPYFQLRCYGNDKSLEIGAEEIHDCLGWAGMNKCGRCYVCNMLKVCVEVYRVLRDDGVFFLNIGDTYDDDGVLLGVSWSCALALNHNEWMLRADMPWIKPNPMPESCNSRPGKATENVFMLTKTDNYFFDMQAVRQPGKTTYTSADFLPNSKKDLNGDGKTAANGASQSNRSTVKIQGRNFRSCDLWYTSAGVVGLGDNIIGLDIPVARYEGAHTATFSPRMIEPLILSGTSEYGCCAKCGEQYKRVIDKSEVVHAPEEKRGIRDRTLNNANGSTGSLDGTPATRTTVGWRKVCACDCDDVVPCLVLDPFIGSGTTAATAIMHGRHGIGIDLNEKYLRENAVPRIEAAIRGEKVARKTVAKVLTGAPPLAAKPMVFGRKM